MSQSLLPSTLLNQLGLRQGEGEPASISLDRRALMGLALCALFIVLVALGPFLATTTSDGAEEGSSFRQISYLLVFGGAIALAGPWRRGWSMIAMPIPIVAALLWCWVSVTWAIEPGISFRRLLLTTVVIWTAFILLHSEGYRRTTDGIRIGLVVILAINYLTVWFDPAVGLHQGVDGWLVSALAGDWRGVMTHKNFAGAACAISILLFLLDARHIKLWIRGLVILAATYFLYRSESKTSIGMVVLAASVGYGCGKLKRQLRLFLVPLAILLICGFATFFSAYSDTIGSKTLAPTAFTGRGQIWAALLLYLKDHPLLGAGFESFWNIGGSSPIYTYGHGYVTTITAGHNGYLDLLVTVGVPGTLMIVWGALLWPLVQIVSSERIDLRKGSLLCALSLFCIGHNVTESSLFERDALTGVIAIFVAAFATYSLRKGSSGRSSKSRSRKAGDDVMADMRARRTKRRREGGALSA